MVISPELWCAIGGGAGALMRQVADQGIYTLSKETAGKVFIGACSMALLLPVAPWISDDAAFWLRHTTEQVPWLGFAIAGAFSWSGIDFTWLLAQRFRSRKNGT